MRLLLHFCAAMCASLALLGAGPQTKDPAPAPRLERRGAAFQLIVYGRPFLVLGGQVHNNSASSLDYMKPIWPR